MDPCLQTRGAAGGGRGPCRPGTRHSGPCAWRGRSGAQRRGVPFRGPFPASERGLGCSRVLSGIQPKLSLSSRSPSQPALPPRAPLIAPQSRAPGQAQASARAWGRAWGRGALGAAATGTGTGTAGDRDSRMKTRSAPASAYLRGLAWARLPTSPRSLRQGWVRLRGKRRKLSFLRVSKSGGRGWGGGASLPGARLALANTTWGEQSVSALGPTPRQVFVGLFLSHVIYTDTDSQPYDPVSPQSSCPEFWGPSDRL